LEEEGEEGEGEGEGEGGGEREGVKVVLVMEEEEEEEGILSCLAFVSSWSTSSISFHTPPSCSARATTVLIPSPSMDA